MMPRGFATSPGCVTLDQPAQITAVIERLRGTQHAFTLPLYRAALAGEIGVVQVAPGGRVPVRLLDHTRPATVLVVAGDPASGAPAALPEAFPQARRLLAWAASTMLHATGGQEHHYRAVVEAARIARRVLLIETATAQEDAWLELLQAEGERRRAAGRELPSLVVSARPRGGLHPVAGGGR